MTCAPAIAACAFGPLGFLCPYKDLIQLAAFLLATFSAFIAAMNFKNSQDQRYLKEFFDLQANIEADIRKFHDLNKSGNVDRIEYHKLVSRVLNVTEIVSGPARRKKIDKYIEDEFFGIFIGYILEIHSDRQTPLFNTFRFFRDSFYNEIKVWVLSRYNEIEKSRRTKILDTIFGNGKNARWDDRLWGTVYRRLSVHDLLKMSKRHWNTVTYAE